MSRGLHPLSALNLELRVKPALMDGVDSSYFLFLRSQESIIKQGLLDYFMDPSLRWDDKKRSRGIIKKWYESILHLVPHATRPAPTREYL